MSWAVEVSEAAIWATPTAAPGQRQFRGPPAGGLGHRRPACPSPAARPRRKAAKHHTGAAYSRQTRKPTTGALIIMPTTTVLGRANASTPERQGSSRRAHFDFGVFR
jgi:hypothetical protein